MIKVRADLGSDERITIEEADSWINDNGNLLLFQGEELVAEFRTWAYVILNPPQLNGGIPSIPTLQETIKLPEPRPLNLSLGQPAA